MCIEAAPTTIIVTTVIAIALVVAQNEKKKQQQQNTYCTSCLSRLRLQELSLSVSPSIARTALVVTLAPYSCTRFFYFGTHPFCTHTKFNMQKIVKKKN